MSLIKLTRSGYWYLYSNTDERWNCSGPCQCGGFVMPSEATDALNKLTEELGKPPEDLQWGYEKE